MLTEKLTELERRLTFVESELAVTRAQNQALWRRCRVASARRLLGLSVLIVFALIVTTRLPLASASAQASVGRYEVPVIFVGKSGKTIAEIREDPGHYGLFVYSPSGGAAQLGGAKQDGSALINLFAPGSKAVAQISEQGIAVYDGATRKALAAMGKFGLVAYNSEGTGVASLGTKPNGSGFMSLGNQNGAAVVEAGMVEPDRGIVRAYPIGGASGGLGLPWGIIGKK